jgi:aspartate/methionine/tyrosine aminotransferase
MTPWRASNRLPPLGLNAVSQMVERFRRDGIPFTDLTLSNPTRAGISYPAALLEPLASPAALRYEPAPLGMAAARAAVARDCGRRGASVDPGQVVLCASTSEAYGWLFKLLCDPGDTVLVPRPSYPLFEHLTRLDGVTPHLYDLEYHGRWEIDFGGLLEAPRNTRAVLLVSPNNPTGSFVSRREVERMSALCLARGWALVADEVFADYALDEADPYTDLASRAEVLTFTLGGASKSLGLPQLKLGWIVVGGPASDRRAAIESLEIVADTYLSVGTPVQLAAPLLLESAAPVREAIHARVRSNLDLVRSLVRRYPSCDVLHTGGGWAAVMRIPATRPEEQRVLELLERARVLMHPGYFFDFPHEAFLVTSLLTPPDELADALGRVMPLVSESGHS